MNLPFFYPEHPEFKQHVQYVAGELMDFYFKQHAPGSYDFEETAAARAKDIVLWVGSRPVHFIWLRELVDALMFRRRETDEIFEAGLERYLREAVEQVEQQIDTEISQGAYSTQADVTSAFKAGLFAQLDVDAHPEGKQE